MTKAYYLICLILFFLGSCQSNPSNKSVESDQPVDAETLMRINRELVNKDLVQNEAYARLHNWNYLITANGLIYEILDRGAGAGVQTGDRVTYQYRCSLLDGTLCYSSEELGPKSFVVDYQEIEAGLNDLSKLLTPGDSVRAILPPHLAFGLVGDGRKIPARASLIYHLRLEKVASAD